MNSTSSAAATPTEEKLTSLDAFRRKYFPKDFADAKEKADTSEAVSHDLAEHSATMIKTSFSLI